MRSFFRSIFEDWGIRWLRKVSILLVFLAIILLNIKDNPSIFHEPEKTISPKQENYREISDTVKKGETLFDIFKKYKLDLVELFKLKEASADIHKLKNLHPGRPYKIVVADNDKISLFTYWINDDHVLNITRTESGFNAEKIAVNYEKEIIHRGGTITDNLIWSMGEGEVNLMLALKLSDIFAWDIDFTTDLRNGDTFKIVVEGFYLNSEFRKYGDILSAEFINNGEIYRAYRFEHSGKVDYYDADGKSLRKSFLKAPLSFRRISSGFSKKRFHPILKTYKPHLGVDYAAPERTPVSTVGDGTVVFAGYKGQNGNIAVIRHFNGYETYYGHLSRLRKGIKTGVKVKQGQIIGYVGATGLTTGPHLDYRMKVNNKFVNPLALKLPRGNPIPGELMAEFKNLRTEMDNRLASITSQTFVVAGKNEDKNKI